jgi:putative thioredoxin
MSISPYIIDAGRNNFDEAVLTNSHKGPVMVNYWAEGAGPCLRLWPVLEKLANDYAGKFLLVNVSTDEDNKLARDYGVTSVPTVKLFINGEVVDQIHGAESEQSFRKMLDQYVARDSDIELARAVAEYQQDNLEEAFNKLSQLVFMDPENPRIQLTHAKLLIREQRYDDAFELLEKSPLKNENVEAGLLMANALFLSTAATSPDAETLKQSIEADSADMSLWLQLASQNVVHSEYTEAMDALLHIFKTDKNYRDGLAGICLRAVFTLLGNDDSSVKEYRQRMLDA